MTQHARRYRGCTHEKDTHMGTLQVNSTSQDHLDVVAANDTRYLFPFPHSSVIVKEVLSLLPSAALSLNYHARL